MKDRFIRMNKSCQYFNLSELEKYDLCKKRYLKKEKYKLSENCKEILIDNFNKCIKRAENRDCVKYSEKEKYILSKSYEYFIKIILT